MGINVPLCNLFLWCSRWSLDARTQGFTLICGPQELGCPAYSEFVADDDHDGFAMSSYTTVKSRPQDKVAGFVHCQLHLHGQYVRAMVNVKIPENIGGGGAWRSLEE